MRILLKIFVALLIACSGVIGCGVILVGIISIYQQIFGPESRSNGFRIMEIIYSTFIIFIGAFMVWFTPKLIRWGGDCFDSLYEQAVNCLQTINCLPKQQEKRILELQRLNEKLQKRKV